MREVLRAAGPGGGYERQYNGMEQYTKAVVRADV